MNDAVKEAVSKVVLNPAVILEPLRKLNEADARENRDRENVAQVVERESKRLAAEEQRILDAYRTGVISPGQLAGQLETLKAQRASLDLQRSRSEHATTIPGEQVEKSVTDYCAEAAANLAVFSDDQWQDLLRTVVKSIIFEGSNIVIQGKIPIPEAGDSGAPISIRSPVPTGHPPTILG